MGFIVKNSIVISYLRGVIYIDRITTNNQYYTDIANAIRTKNNSYTTYLQSQMGATISNLTTLNIITLT